MAVPIYYWSKLINFGDALNPLILQNIFNLKIQLVDHRNAVLFPCGSILQKVMASKWSIGQRFHVFLKPTAVVWTSGLLKQPKKDVTFCRKVSIMALRGEKSKRCVENILGHKISVPLGDGGLLMPRLLQEMPPKTIPLGIIPHFVDIHSPRIQQLLVQFPQAQLISPIISSDEDIPTKCIEILRTIASCEAILSSSLHGLIAADALHIPNRHVIDDHLNGSFKFDDYRSAFGDLDHPISIDDFLQNKISLDDIFSKYQISPDQIAEVSEKIYTAFPRTQMNCL